MRFEGARGFLALEPLRDPAEADCAGCHPSIAREWERSLHRHAVDDAVFASAYALEPRPSCLHCHAPRGPSTPGIDCIACHVRLGEVVGAHRREGSPHGGPVDPTMLEADVCADCHQFDFPDDVDLGLPPSGEPMQDTVREWIESPAAAQGRACQSCHMPDRSGHLDHQFAVRGDAAQLRAAVEVDVRCVPGAIEVALRPTAALGHAIPTGDLFRRMVLRVTTDEAVSERVFARGWSFEPAHRPDGTVVLVRREADDTRLRAREGATETRIERFATTGASRARVTLDYLLEPESNAAAAGLPDEINRTRIYELEAACD